MDRFSEIFVKAVEAVKNSVVKIDVFRGKSRRSRNAGSGSGFFFSSDGMFFTNNHVVEKASRIEVTFLDGQKHVAEAIGADPHTDLAVVKSPGTGYSVAKLGDSDELQIGQIVLALGNPLGYQHSVTHGILSGTNRNLRASNGGIIDNVLQTDAPLNPGNSGGPLIDTDGSVIGVSSAIIRGAQGLSFAIDINTAKDVAYHLIKDGRVVKARLGLGIQQIEINKRVRNFHNIENSHGLIVVSVENGSPADRAGIKEGDIILSFNSKVLLSSSTLFRALTTDVVGDECELIVIRNGNPRTLQIYPELMKAS